MPSPTTIPQYISSAPKQSQKHLRVLLSTIRKVAPKATEGLKWSMPAFSYKRILVTFAGFEKHVGLYPTPSAIKKFSKELSKYKTGMGSIQFPIDKPLPVALIKKIVGFRVKEALEKDGKWKS